MTDLTWSASVWLSRGRHTARYLAAAPFTYRNWWAVAFSKVGKNVVLEVRNGTRYFVRAGTADLAAVNETVIQNPYLRSGGIELPADATVIDIGAYIGDFTVQAAQACPRGRILAVDPIEAHLRMIERQIALNQLANVQTIRAAIGDRNALVGLAHGGMASRTVLGVQGTVEMVTLERLMDRYGVESVDLLKLDCEGAEWDILPAAEPVLSRVRQISMEFHAERGWTAPRMAAWLRARGFTVSHTSGRWNGLLWARRPAPLERRLQSPRAAR